MAGGKIDILVNPDVKDFPSKMEKGLSPAVATAAKVGTGIAVALGGAFAAKGFDRLSNIDQAEAKLTGLGHSADNVASIMDNALGAVQGTAFGMGEAASTAASLVAANIPPGQELERTLTLVGDAAAIAGTDLQSMGSIFNKVATDGRIQGDVLNQLGDRGIPILQLLADQLGVTAEAAREMASDGEVSFEVFLNAVEAGMGGAALAAGDTFAGAMDNAWAAVSRTGAAFLEPGFSAAPGVITGITERIDDLQPAAAAAGAAVMDFASGAASVLGPLVSTVGDLASEHRDLVVPLAAAGAALAVGKWRNWGEAVGGAGSKFSGFAREIAANQDFFRRMGTDVSALTATWVTLEEKIPVVGRVGDAYRNAAAPMRDFSARQRDLAATAQGAALQSRDLFETIDLMSQSAVRRAGARVSDFAGTVRGGLSAAVEGARSAGRGLVDALGGGWNVAIAGAAMAATVITSEIAKTQRSQELLRELEDQAGTTGEALYEALASGDVGAGVEALNASLQDLLDTQKQLADTSPGVGGTATSMLRNYLADINPFDGGKTGRDVADEWRAQREAAQTAREFSEAIEQAGINAEEAATAVGGSAAQYDALISSLDLTTEGGRAARDVLQEQRDAYLEMQGLTESLAPGSVELSEALALIGDEAASSEERVSALNDALNNMLGIDPDADEAIAGLHEEIDKVTESAENALDQAKGWGEGLFGGSGVGGLDLAQENSRNLRDTLLSMRDSLLDVAIAGEDVDAAFAAQQPALDALAAQYGISGDRVRELATDMGLVPSLIESTVTISVEDALSGLEEVWGAIEKNQLKVDEPLKLPVANVDDAIAALEDTEIAVEELHRSADGSGAIEITADTQQAIWDVELLIYAMRQISSDKGITFHSDAPDQIDLVRQLGVDIEDLGNGEYRIKSNTPEEIEHLIELGLLVKDKKTGAVKINSNLDEVLEKGKELDRRNGRQTRETHEVLRHERTVRDITYAQTAGGTRPITGWMADGGVRYAADGMLSKQDAHIARGGDWLVWAEDETQGESFIPHAPSKRKRSTQILAETASIFGMGLVDLSTGAAVRRDGTSVAPTGRAMADGGVIGSITRIVEDRFPALSVTSTVRPGEANHHGWGEAVDISNQYSGGPSTPEMQEAARFFFTEYGSMLAELIHWPLNGWQNIDEGKPFDFGPTTNAQHTDHVHIASREPLPAPGSGPGAGAGAARPLGFTKTESRSMVWNAAKSTDADFGSAADLFDSASSYLRVPERQAVDLGITRVTTSYEPGLATGITPAGLPPGEGWGHDFFVHEIARQARDLGLPEKGAMIGVGTARVEASTPLKMWANHAVPESLNFRHDAIGSDHDSVGLFQQRNNGAWGTVAQRMDPYASAGLFYDAMLRKFPNWQDMDPGAVAQGVQVSAFPDRYAGQMAPALDDIKRIGIYDTGGWLMPGQMGINLSPNKEPVLNHGQWSNVSNLVNVQIPAMVASTERLVRTVEGVAAARPAEVRAGATSDDVSALTQAVREQTRWLDETQLVIDAERGLAETRLQATEDVETLRKAEDSLSQAQENLAIAQSESATLSVSMQRRVADAEKAVAEARAEASGESVANARKVEDAEIALAKARKGGKADSIADAERRLARVHEDIASKTAEDAEKRAERIADAEEKLARVREDAAVQLAKSNEEQSEQAKRAAEDVAKAEEELADARANAESAALRIEAAERAVIAARFQSIANLAGQIGPALDAAAGGFSNLMSALAQGAAAMEQTRQQLVAERLEVQRLTTARRRSALDAIIAEQDVAKAKAQGAVNVADAEAHLAGIRQESMASGAEATAKGATGIDAMSKAMDRARVTGKFAVEDVAVAQVGASRSVASSMVSHADQVAVAEQNVAAAKAQSALDELTAAHTHRMAVLDLAEATLLQQQAVALVDVSTRQLQAQAARLGGLTAQGAERAASGWGGLAQAGGGLGKLLGGLAGGAAGYATGGPLGALLGGGAGVIGGLFDIFGGLRDAWTNRDEIAQAFEGMSLLDKIIAGGGIILGGGVAAAGVAGVPEYGAEIAGVAAELGGQIAERSAQYAQDAVTSDLERINSLAEEERQRIQEKVAADLVELDQIRANDEMEYAKGSVALGAEIEIAEYLGKIVEANTPEQVDALAEAAIVAAERRDQMLDLLGRQLDLQEKQANAPKPSLTVNIPPSVQQVDREVLESLVDTVGRIQDAVDVKKTSIGGSAYIGART